MKITLKKGYNLPIAGAVADLAPRDIPTASAAIVPDDFPGFVPKPDVAPGDTVRAGDALLHDKKHPEIKLVSPVAGTVKAVERGERRKLLKVEIEVSGSESKTFETACNTPFEATTLLAESGLLAMMRQRPYDIIPDPEVRPRDFFVTAIYSSPLELPLEARVSDADKPLLDAAADFLFKIALGKVYISHDSSWKLGAIKNAEMVELHGPHPAGLAGVQIANIAPVNKGETVWTLDIETLRRIGHLITHKTLDASAVVGVCGPMAAKPYVARTVIGATIEPLVKGIEADDHLNHRIVSGNILVGKRVDRKEHLRYPYRQITILDEGDDIVEFMGWASMSPSKMSVYRTFPGYFLHKLFKPDARLLGGRRAMIMSGEYDRMMPMDILPEYLLKAIIARDIDNMERLGIYEVAPEDFALAEYADTSKLPLQPIVREGLDYLRKELE